MYFPARVNIEIIVIKKCLYTTQSSTTVASPPNVVKCNTVDTAKKVEKLTRKSEYILSQPLQFRQEAIQYFMGSTAGLNSKFSFF